MGYSLMLQRSCRSHTTVSMARGEADAQRPNKMRTQPGTAQELDVPSQCQGSVKASQENRLPPRRKIGEKEEIEVLDD